MTDEEIDQLAGEAASRSLIARAAQTKGGIVNRFIKPAVLPTAGGIAGAAFGGGVGTPFGMTVPGSIAGASIGSALGEAGNQALGITDPSLGDIGLAAAIPAAVGTVSAGVRALMPFARAGKAAATLNALAPDEAAARVGKLAPKVPAAALFKQATEARVTIPMNRTLHMLDDMLDDLTNVSGGVQKANSQVIGYLKGLKAKLTTSPGGLTPLALQRELEGAGNVVKSVNARGGTGSGAIKQSFKAMIDDLDDAAKMANPALPAAQTLVQARNAFKRESVLSEIGDAITDATKNLRGQGELVQFNANAVLKSISKNRFYTQALSASERGEIEGLLKLLNKIPALRPGAGAQFGSGRLLGALRMSAFGGGVGAAVGGSAGGAAGAAIGVIAPPIVEFGRNVSVAMQMQTGRALLKELLTQSKGVATPQVASILAAYTRAVTETPELGQ